MEKKPKQQTGFSEKEIGEAIKEGAITKQYLADPHTIVSSLNRLRSTEITSYLQYKQHAYMAVSLLSPGLKTEFEAHAVEELGHADTLANRIQQLGGVPSTTFKNLEGKAASSAFTLSKERRSSKWWAKINARTPTSGGVTRAHSGDRGQGSGHTTAVLEHPAKQRRSSASELADFLKRSSDTRR